MANQNKGIRKLKVVMLLVALATPKLRTDSKSLAILADICRDLNVDLNRLLTMDVRTAQRRLKKYQQGVYDEKTLEKGIS